MTITEAQVRDLLGHYAAACVDDPTYGSLCDAALVLARPLAESWLAQRARIAELEDGAEINALRFRVVCDLADKRQARIAELEALLRRVSEREIAHVQRGILWCNIFKPGDKAPSPCTCGQWELTAAIEQALAAGEAT
jgi:hypothetical protein